MPEQTPALAVWDLLDPKDKVISLANTSVCRDCQATDVLMKIIHRGDGGAWLHQKFDGFSWDMARMAVGNDRSEQYRLPGAPMGLVYAGIMRPSEHGELDKHQVWLVEQGFIDPDSLDWGEMMNNGNIDPRWTRRWD